MPAILEKWEIMPHDDLVEVDDGVLTVAGKIRMPLGNFPRRMTVVRLTAGRTAIYSAIALNEPEMRRIEAMGAPAFLIVPGDHHRLDARIWKQRYPDIRVIAPPGAVEAVEEAVHVDATGDILDDPDTKLVIMPGAGGHEAALEIRRASGLTIVANDLIANVAHPHGIGAQIMARLMGFGVSEPQIPRVVRHLIVEDKVALAQQFADWAAEPDLRRIVVSHGDVIEGNAAEVLRTLADALN
ncbi:hypothetical protein IAG41_21345 [Sphingomonas sp. JC676]|uniref:hypothetical protein n=1 Tax=Sphingomonas sp. JC676 TaxID=2768065 RepID=UPI0016577D05|nr:hypothetical protein [Sphingomonas sp. JC676]MBC9034945.1 hypothetical protein [Sphingomonas sp. JC676]